MICVPIKNKDKEKVLKTFIKSQKIKFVDMAEIWFDKLPSLDLLFLKRIQNFKKKPIIYKSSGDIKKIKKVIKTLEIEYLDIDLTTSLEKINEIKKITSKTKLIISYHNFKETPRQSKLEKIAKKIITKKADIIKIATKATSFKDALTMLELLNSLNGKGKKAICICMGQHGVITRVAGHLIGNYLMYAPLNKSQSTAKGQLTVSELCL